MHFKKAVIRFFLFALFCIFFFAAGIHFLGAGSIFDLVHFLAIPLVLGFYLIFKPAVPRKNIVPYLILTAFITCLPAGYFIAFTKAVPLIKIKWSELPIAVYFLLSVYTIIWLGDKIINLWLSFVLIIKNSIAKNAVKGIARTGFMIFVALPYLIATFTTHWIKFAGVSDLRDLSGINYQRVSFNGSDGTKLDGLFIPSTTGLSDSSVIIAPGRCPSKNFFLTYADVLANNGYNVFLFDSRGNGDSSGHKYSFTINEANDIICAIDCLKATHRQYSRNIFGLGVNEGAAALICAAGIDSRLNAAVIDNASGFEACVPEDLSDYLPEWLDKTLSKLIRTAVTIDIGRTDWGREKIYDYLPQISPCPVLFTNGIKNDKSARIRTIELFAKAKEPKLLWMTPLQTEQRQDIGTEMEYFKNILNIFDYAREKNQGSGRTT